MDSSYLHYHHHVNGPSSSSSSSSSSSPSLDNTTSSSSSSSFGVVLHGADSHSWTPNPSLIDTNYRLTSSPSTEAILKSRDSTPTTHENFHPMSQNPAGFQWPELSDIPSNNFPRFTDMLINGTSASILDGDLQLRPSSFMKSNNDLSVELSQKLMLKTLLLSSSSRTDGGQSRHTIPTMEKDDDLHFPSGGRGLVFSQIYPSINISNPNGNYQSSSCGTSSSLDSNWSTSTFDLLGNCRFSTESDDKALLGNNSLGTVRESLPFGLYDHIKPSISQRLSSSSFDQDFSTASPYIDHKMVEAKRPSSSVEAKTSQAGSKKTRLESRSSSCPPMKVRKEKLGDRIAALQQLVAPFGKTDTASVLMEAIGYINFLQNQVQTLSVPYMKSSRNDNNSRTPQWGSREDGNEEPAARPDLRSRGLCLVPLTCMSYVTNDGGGVWPPPGFRGGF